MSKQNKKNKNNINKLEAKRNEVLNQKSKKLSSPKIIFGILILIAITAVFLISSKEDTDTTNVTVSDNTAEINAAVVKYPVSLFDDHKAKFFKYKKNNITIKFFVLKSSDGIIRAAFDACDVCWRAGKGYRQEGDEMICINCGRRFESVRINEVSGGCNPAPLRRRIENENVVISIPDIVEGSRYFDLSTGI